MARKGSSVGQGAWTASGLGTASGLFLVEVVANNDRFCSAPRLAFLAPDKLHRPPPAEERKTTLRNFRGRPHVAPAYAQRDLPADVCLILAKLLGGPPHTRATKPSCVL